MLEDSLALKWEHCQPTAGSLDGTLNLHQIKALRYTK
jgi:hypothetical protein